MNPTVGSSFASTFYLYAVQGVLFMMTSDYTVILLLCVIRFLCTILYNEVLH